MALRRKARTFALQMLFQWDLNRQVPARLAAQFWKGVRAEKTTRAFAEELFFGATRQVEAVDKLLAQHIERWRLDRLAAMDRNILRLAVYELTYLHTPAKVVINEAIELARKFSDAEAPAFVNGVLDAVNQSLATRP